MALDYATLRTLAISKGGYTTAPAATMLQEFYRAMTEMNTNRAPATPHCPSNTQFNISSTKDLSAYQTALNAMKAQTCACQTYTAACTCNPNSCTCQSESVGGCSCVPNYGCTCDFDASCTCDGFVNCPCNSQTAGCGCNTYQAACTCNAVSSSCNCNSYFNS